MDKKDFESQFEYVCEEPLMNADGTLNPKCMPALYDVLANMPLDYERFANNPEWSSKEYTHFREIIGSFALWAVRIIPDKHNGGITIKNSLTAPPNLLDVLNHLRSDIANHFDASGFAHLSLCDISRMLYHYIYNYKPFVQWNLKGYMGDSWIGLDALIHNVCMSIRNERRQNAESNAKIDRELAENKIKTKDGVKQWLLN